MSYCLLKIGDRYEITDRTFIRGPELAWEDIEVVKKGGKTRVKALYVNGGKRDEMEKLLKDAVNGEIRLPRKRKEPQFSIVEPAESDVEEEGKRSRPMRAASRFMQVLEMSPDLTPDLKRVKKERGTSIPPVADTPATSHPPKSTFSSKKKNTGTVTLDTIYGLLVDLKGNFEKLNARQDRLERTCREIYNDTVGVRHEVNQPLLIMFERAHIFSQSRLLMESTKDRSIVISTGPLYGIYEGITEEMVAAIDDTEESIECFAGKLDVLLFHSSTLSHPDRDQEKLEWLIKVVLHRRRITVKAQKRKWKGLILGRINHNARREEGKQQERLVLSQPRRAVYTPPVLLSAVRPSSTAAQFPSTPRVSSPLTTTSHFPSTPRVSSSLTVASQFPSTP
ncbi:hypothetical protein PMAYCL1PPCAC_04971, partial [Pristionchus mayeri]